MKVIHVSSSDAIGGAARATYRIHRALCSSGVKSLIFANKAILDDKDVITHKRPVRKCLSIIRPWLATPLRKLSKNTETGIISPAIFPGTWLDELNRSDADVVHLHWIQDEMISIEDIGRIMKPVVWTMHDMWPFCGAEHYTQHDRWILGYTKCNRPASESGWDINKWSWERKLKHWDQPFVLVANSYWMQDCVEKSYLFRGLPVRTIHYPLDTSFWKPLEKASARRIMNLPVDKKLVLYGAAGGAADPRKGFSYLMEALDILSKSDSTLGFELVVFGQDKCMDPIDTEIIIHNVGQLNNDECLRALYSSADVMVVPSILEAFGQTASEAQACEVPVIAFRIGGLKDIVIHLETGYLADPLSIDDLSNGIEWALKESQRTNLAGKSGRKHIQRLCNSDLSSQRYIQCYEEAIDLASYRR
jgi:glycosyltransferase involved in cell wall biosynthesis